MNCNKQFRKNFFILMRARFQIAMRQAETSDQKLKFLAALYHYNTLIEGN